MRFVPFNEVEKSAWDALVEASGDGWLYQTHGHVVWAGLRLEQLSFAVYTDSGQLKAVMPLYLQFGTPHMRYPALDFVVRGINYLCARTINRRPLSLRRLITGYAGPVLAPDLGAKGRRKLWRLIFTHVDQIAAQKRADILEVRLTDIAQANMPPMRPAANPLWEVGVYEPMTVPPRLFVPLDLLKSEEELRLGMDQDCRNEVSRAQREGVLTREGVENELPLYHAIHASSWARTGARPQSLQHYQEMYRYLGGDRIKIFFAEYQGKPVAAVMLHLFKDSAFYWGGCSYPDAQKVKANNLLLFSAVLWAKRAGLKRFGIGLFDCAPGANMKEYTVGKYKAQFSADWFEALEGARYYTSRGLRDASERRRQVLRARRARICV